MKIGMERYQNIFESVLNEAKINTAQLQPYEGEFERVSRDMTEKMTKRLSSMAGSDGQLYSDSEVAIANNHYFKKCMTGCCKKKTA